jgi:hypothetical protein
MSAQDRVRLKLLNVPSEAQAGIAGQKTPNTIHAAGNFEIIGFAKHHAPKLRRVLDDFDVAVRYNFAVERRKELNEVEALDDIIGAGGAPRFIQGCGGGQVPAASRNSCNQDTHGLALRSFSSVH